MLKKIFKNTGCLSADIIINNILFLILLIYIAKNYGVEFVGKYTFIFAITGLIFTRLGYKDLIIRTIARDKAKTGIMFGNMIIIEFFLILVRFLILGLYLTFVYFPAELKIAIIIASIVGILMTGSHIMLNIFIAHQRMKYIPIQGTANYTTTVFFGILFLIMGFGLIGLVTAFLIGHFVAFMINIYITISLFYLPKFDFNKRFMKWLFKEGWPFIAGTSFAAIAGKSNVVILHLFTDFTTVGIYTAALRIISAIEEIPHTFLVSLYPQFSFLFTKSRKNIQELYKKSLTYLMIFGIFGLFGLFLFAKFIILTIFSTEFLEAVNVLKMMGFIMLFSIFSILNSFLLYAVGKQRIQAYLIIIFGTVNLILDIILTWIYGIYGLLCSSLIVLVIIVILQRKIINLIFQKI